MSLVYYKELENDDWLLPNFTPHELACRCCGRIADTPVARDARIKLQQLRGLLGLPLAVVSGTRCAAHNRAVGGAERSLHLTGQAFDLKPVGHLDGVIFRTRLINIAGRVGLHGVGWYETFVHLDSRSQHVAWFYS